MAVYHVLKDGTKLNDITGYVVKYSEVPAVYDLIHKMNQRKSKNIQESGMKVT